MPYSSARAMALSSGQVDAVFWSRSCVGAREVVEDGIAWRDMFDPEDDEDLAMMDRIDEVLLPAFDYAGYNTKDIPAGLIASEYYYSDNTVLIAKK